MKAISNSPSGEVFWSDTIYIETDRPTKTELQILKYYPLSGTEVMLLEMSRAFNLTSNLDVGLTGMIQSNLRDTSPAILESCIGDTLLAQDACYLEYPTLRMWGEEMAKQHRLRVIIGYDDQRAINHETNV